MTPSRAIALQRRSWLTRRAIEIAGWTLTLIGLLALVLPGPGLLTIAAGLVLLSTRYTWANRLLHPVKSRALRLAAKGVQNWLPISISVAGGLLLVALGITWGLEPPVPGWWPLHAHWWLLGGWATGITLIASGAIALALIVYSFRRFRIRADKSSDTDAGPHEPVPAVSRRRPPSREDASFHLY